MHETARALLAEREGAVLARSLMRRIDRAALATSLEGAPYASLVLSAVDLDAVPLLFLSDLAQHCRNVAADPRIALLFDGTSGHSDPLAGPRLTVLGKLGPSDDPRLLARFMARHPASQFYAGFADFRLYRITVERCHLVAGFGRIEWIPGLALTWAGDVTALAAAEPEIVAQMNADHAEAIDRFAERLLARAGKGWHMTGIDPEGLDLRHDAETARLDFLDPVTTPEAARRTLALLTAGVRGPIANHGNL
jgi:heme iron utilization protein